MRPYQKLDTSISSTLPYLLFSRTAIILKCFITCFECIKFNDAYGLLHIIFEKFLDMYYNLCQIRCCSFIDIIIHF